MKPFDWQAGDIRTLAGNFKKSPRGVYQLATGGGKSVVAGLICQTVRAEGNKALILVHRKELVEQFIDTLRKVDLAHDVGVIHPQYPATPWAPIQVASVFSLVRREIKFDPRLIIVDEAHHARAATWEKVLRRWPDALVLGLTATPKRTDGKGLGEQFDWLHCGPAMSALIAMQNLAPLRTIRIKPGFDFKKFRSQAGDWNKKDVAAQAVTPAIVGKALGAYQEFAPGERFVFFGVTIPHSKAMAEQFRAAGYRVEHVDGEMHDGTRTRIMRMLKAGELDGVCNVALIDEGFDCPSVSCVIDQRPTKSIVKYLQGTGRAMRWEPDKVGIHIDAANNIVHGLPEDPREWSLDKDAPNGEKGDGKAPASTLRCCTGCSTVYSIRYPACPSCGSAPPSRPVIEVDVEFEEVSKRLYKTPTRPKKADLEGMIQDAKKAPKPRDALEELRIVMGYPPQWTDQTAELLEIP